MKFIPLVIAMLLLSCWAIYLPYFGVIGIKADARFTMAEYKLNQTIKMLDEWLKRKQMIKQVYLVQCDKCGGHLGHPSVAGAIQPIESEAEAKKVWLQKDGRQLCPKCDDQVHQFIKADDLPKKGWQPGYFMKKSPPAKVQSKIQGEYRHDGH